MRVWCPLPARKSVLDRHGTAPGLRRPSSGPRLPGRSGVVGRPVPGRRDADAVCGCAFPARPLDISGRDGIRSGRFLPAALRAVAGSWPRLEGVPSHGMGHAVDHHSPKINHFIQAASFWCRPARPLPGPCDHPPGLYRLAPTDGADRRQGIRISAQAPLRAARRAAPTAWRREVRQRLRRPG